MSVLVNRVDALSQKAGLGPLGMGATRLPAWKRWIGGEKPEYDGSGLRDVVQTNAIYLDAVKGDLDNFKDNNGTAHASFNTRLLALEAQINNPPFPG